MPELWKLFKHRCGGTRNFFRKFRHKAVVLAPTAENISTLPRPGPRILASLDRLKSVFTLH
jgi:hypothetical protein